MNLQTIRPPNLAQAHDSRFEIINKNPSVLSSFRKVPTVNFKKQFKQARDQHFIDETSHNHMQRYYPKDSLVTKRTSIGTLDLKK